MFKQEQLEQRDWFLLKYVCWRPEDHTERRFLFSVICFMMLSVLHYKAVSLLKQLGGGFPQRWPGFEPRSDHVGFVVDSVVLGQVSPPSSHSTDCSTFIIIIYHPELVK
jgi:hypothetical protein